MCVCVCVRGDEMSENNPVFVVWDSRPLTNTHSPLHPSHSCWDTVGGCQATAAALYSENPNYTVIKHKHPRAAALVFILTL